MMRRPERPRPARGPACRSDAYQQERQARWTARRRRHGDVREAAYRDRADPIRSDSCGHCRVRRRAVRFEAWLRRTLGAGSRAGTVAGVRVPVAPEDRTLAARARGQRDRPDHRPAPARHRRDRGRADRDRRRRCRTGRARGDQRRPGGHRAGLGNRPGRPAGCWRPDRSRPGCSAPSARSRSGPGASEWFTWPAPGSPWDGCSAALALAAAIADGGAGWRRCWRRPSGGADPLGRAHRRDRPRRGSNRLARSAARPAVGFAVRLLAHGRGQPGRFATTSTAAAR